MDRVLITSRHQSEDFENKKPGYYYCNEGYIDSLNKIGVSCVLSVSNNIIDYDEFIKDYDGLLVAGGEDVDPKYYHQKQHEKTEIINDKIEEMDFKLIEAFVKAKKPILGICRGIQILNVYFGGSLNQHYQGHIQEAYRTNATHKVILEDHTIWSEPVILVNTFHHQIIDQLANDFKIVGYSEDGVIEAIKKDNIVAVQWHPEYLMDQQLFIYFHKLIKEKKYGI